MTEFGKFCRILRLERDENMQDMAKRIGTSLSYLSMIEHGHRNVPKNWPDTIAKAYSLGKRSRNALNKAVSRSQIRERISLTSLSEEDQHLVSTLAYNISTMTRSRKNQIRKALCISV